MSSDAESKLGALFMNSKYAVPVRKTLGDMGHPQPPTPTQTENFIVYGVVNSNIHPKATKSMHTRFHWLHDRECQK